MATCDGTEFLLSDPFCYVFNLWFQNTNLVSMIGTDFFSPNFCQTSELDDATIILNGGKQIKPEKENEKNLFPADWPSV